MHKSKILIVDDEAINIRLVAKSLQERYQILVALSGLDALNILKNESPDLILLDVNMPEMNGFEVLKHIKNNESSADIPVIFLTGNSSSETILEAFSAGAVDYIVKPFQIKELEIRVENHILRYTLQATLTNTLQQNAHLLKIIDRYVSYVKVSTDRIIQDISSNFCDHLQCSKEHVIGQNISILKSGNTPAFKYEELWKTVASGKTFIHEIEDKNFSGGTNWYKVSISPDFDKNNLLVGYIGFYENIDEKIRFKKNSETDILTSLPNRFKLNELLLQEERRSTRYKQEFSVILVDIDHFKEVNDTYGHQVGDAILKEFSNVLINNIRSIDVVGRWGGEEFLVVCPHTDMSGAYALAENLRKAIETHPFPTIGDKTASFGVAVYQENDTFEALFKKVDDALYRAKENGRNQVVSD